MASFRIHEDIENYPKYAHKKIAKIAEGKNPKKSFLENGSALNGFQVEVNNEKNIGKNFIVKESPKRSDDITLALDILEIEKTKPQPEPEKMEEYFPPCLASNTEYRWDVWQHLLNVEQKFPKVKRNYMAKQTHINWHSRSILIDWLISVADEYKLSEETFHLTVNYIDRFLNSVAVVRTKLQLLGVTAMRIASKMEDYYPMDCKEWSYLTDNTYKVPEIIKMEYVMLKVLKFQMNPPTVLGFLQILCAEYKMEDEVVHMAKYIIETLFLEGQEHLQVLPSQLAVSAIILSRYYIDKPEIWPEELKTFTGYSLKEMSPLVARHLRTMTNWSTNELRAVRDKYAKEAYSKVSKRSTRSK